MEQETFSLLLNEAVERKSFKSVGSRFQARDAAMGSWHFNNKNYVGLHEIKMARTMRTSRQRARAATGLRQRTYCTWYFFRNFLA